MELHPPVGAEHGHALFERIQRLALHPRQRIDLGGESVALRRVVEEIGDAALRIGARHHPERAPVGQMPDRFARLDRLIGGKRLRLPLAEVFLLGQLALGAQRVEDLAVGRLLIEEGRFERPDLPIGGVVEDEPLRPVEDGHRGRQLVEHGAVGPDMMLDFRAQPFDLGEVEREAGVARLGADFIGLEQFALAGDDGGRLGAPCAAGGESARAFAPR